MTDKNPLSAEDITSIVTHMNDDHADAVLLYVNAFTDLEVENIEGVTMTNIDHLGIDVQFSYDGKLLARRILFSDTGTKVKLNSPDKARALLIGMVKIARQKLSP